MPPATRVTDSLIGLLALSALYGLCFFFLSTAGASAMMGVWLVWVVAGIAASYTRPELMKWMTFGSVGSWMLLVFVLAFNG